MIKSISHGLNINKIVYISIIIAITCGVVQNLLGNAIFSWVVEYRTTYNRGVTSLYIEPSFFGMSLVATLIIYQVFDNNYKINSFIVLLVFVGVIILSQSILAIGLLASYLMALFFSSGSLKIIFGILILTILSYFGFGDFESELRIIRLVSLIINTPELLLYSDVSASERFSHIFVSISNAFSDFLLPHGYSAFSEHLAMAAARYFFIIEGNSTNLIGSGIGAALYEIGFPALIYIYLPIYLWIKADRASKSRKDLIAIFVIIII